MDELLTMPSPDPDAVQRAIDKEVEDTTDEDINLMISFFRAERKKFAEAEATGKGAKGARATVRAPRAPATQADVDNILDGLV